MGTGKTKTLRKILPSLAQSGANLPCTIWVSYRKTLSNESEAKLIGKFRIQSRTISEYCGRPKDTRVGSYYRTG